MGINQRSQIVMSDEEIADFITTERTATLATHGPDGTIHLVAMWYGVIDGEVWIETKLKSQKAVNLQRNPRCSISIEAGKTYDQLRGVAIEGKAEIFDDEETILATGISVWERYNGPYTDEVKPLVEFMLHKRVAVRVDVSRTRSWDHRKLGLEAIELGGTEHLLRQRRQRGAHEAARRDVRRQRGGELTLQRDKSALDWFVVHGGYSVSHIPAPVVMGLVCRPICGGRAAGCRRRSRATCRTARTRTRHQARA